MRDGGGCSAKHLQGLLPGWGSSSLVVERSWDPQLVSALARKPPCSLGLAIFPKTRISPQAQLVDGLEMTSGLGDLIPAPCPLLHDKSWIHLHFKAVLEGRFCKAELAG